MGFLDKLTQATEINNDVAYQNRDIERGIAPSAPSRVDAVSSAAPDPNSDFAGSTGMSNPYIGMMDNKTFAGWRARVAKEHGDEAANREFGKERSQFLVFSYGDGTAGRLVKMRQEWVNEKKNGLAGNPEAAAAYLNASLSAPDDSGARQRLSNQTKGIGDSLRSDITDRMAELLLGTNRRRNLPEYTHLVETAVGLCAHFNTLRVDAGTGAIVADLATSAKPMDGDVSYALESARKVVNFHYMGGPDRLGARYFMDVVEQQAQDALDSYDYAKVFYNKDFDYSKGNVLGSIGKSPADLGQAGYAYNQACAQRQIDVGNLLSKAGIRLEDYASGGAGENGLGAVSPQDAERVVASLENGGFNVRVLPDDIESMKKAIAEWKNYDIAVDNIGAQVATLGEDDMAEYLDAYVHGRGDGGAPWWEPAEKLDRAQSFLRSHEQIVKAREASAPLADGTNPVHVIDDNVARMREDGTLDEYDTTKDINTSPNVKTTTLGPISQGY